MNDKDIKEQELKDLEILVIDLEKDEPKLEGKRERVSLRFDTENDPTSGIPCDISLAMKNR